MAVDPNSVLELRISYVANFQRCMNVTHWAPEGNIPGKEPYDAEKDFVDSVRLGTGTQLLQNMLKLMSNEVHVDTIAGQFVWPTRWRAYVWEGSMPGLKADACQNQNLQASIEKIGDQGNRHNIGAFHLGGLPITASNHGMISPGMTADFGFLANSLKENIISGDAITIFEPVILNKVKVVVDGKNKYKINGFSFVVDTDIKEEMRCMNRRTVGRGE